MIRVLANVKEGKFTVIGEDGQKTTSIPMHGYYDKETMQSFRKAIESTKSSKWIPPEKLKLIDVGVYMALRDFDYINKTDYAEKYVNVTTMEIPYTGVSEKKRDYEKRATGIKTKEFLDNGLSVEYYNVSLFGKSNKEGIRGKIQALRERIQVVKLARSQEQNGVKVFSPNKSKSLTLPEMPEDDIPDMPDAKTHEEMRKEDEKINSKVTPVIPEQQQNVPPVAPVIPAPTPNAVPTPEIKIDPKQIEELSNPNQRNIDELLQSMRNADTKGPEIAPAPAVVELEQAIAGRRVASPRRDVQTPKKKISRSKAIQASKKAQRDAGKLKNRYKDMQQAKAERRARLADPEQIRLAAERREQKRIAEEQRKAAEAEQRRLEAERKRAEEERKRQEAEQNKKPKRMLAISTIGAKSQEMVTRFTRKVKDKADSIRNKKFIPELSNKQKKIAKAATIVALTSTLALTSGLATYKLLSNSNRHTADIDNIPSSSSAVETVKPGQTVDKDGIDYILGEHDTQKPVTQTPSQDEVKPSTPAQEENQGGSEEQDSKKEYLSSIKVGASMSIDSGKFFETPEGQGNYGHFENFTNGTKRIQFIDVMTNEGYIVIKDDSVNLWELKQQYPDAKFSYHIVYENEDGTTRSLGWLTEASLDQNVDQQHNMTDIDDMDM